MPKSDAVRVRHMLDAAREAMSFAAGKKREHLNVDRMRTLSCTRLLEVIGEAARQVSPEFRDRYPQVPWTTMTGMRNRLVHAYFDVNLDVLWETLATDLPALIPALEDIMDREES